jgi:hypothetical protein
MNAQSAIQFHEAIQIEFVTSQMSRQLLKQQARGKIFVLISHPASTITYDGYLQKRNL